MISPRGGDPTGEMVSEAADYAGIDDRPFVFLDRKTPSYTAIIERDGNLVIALADMDLYRMFVPRRLSIRSVRDAFAATDFIVFDANLPEDTLAAIVARAKALGKPVGAIAISPAKVVKLKRCMQGIDYLFLNEAEAAALTGERPNDPAHWPSLLGDTGLKGGVVTRGQRELIAFANGRVVALQPADVERCGGRHRRRRFARRRLHCRAHAWAAARGRRPRWSGGRCSHRSIAARRERKSLR
jgi:sugar/nucleoside kinase (ribokinase family)